MRPAHSVCVFFFLYRIAGASTVELIARKKTLDKQLHGDAISLKLGQSNSRAYSRICRCDHRAIIKIARSTIAIKDTTERFHLFLRYARATRRVSLARSGRQVGCDCVVDKTNEEGTFSNNLISNSGDCSGMSRSRLLARRTTGGTFA